MDATRCGCPRCGTVVWPVLAKCYVWGGDLETAFALEILWRCAGCTEVYFPDELTARPLAPAA